MPPPAPKQEPRPAQGPSAPPPLPKAVPATAEDDGEGDEGDGPRLPSPSAGEKRKADDEAQGEDEGEGSDEGFEDDEADLEQFPISHEIVLKDHTKVSPIDYTGGLLS